MTLRKLFLSIAMIAPAALAGGYSIPNMGARDLGMASSLTAAQNSAAAVYANPSELAGLEGFSLAVNAGLIDLRSTWSDPNRQFSAVTMTPKAAFPPSLYASYGGKMNGMGWGVGAGFNVPAG